jgi:hypothetical protein
MKRVIRKMPLKDILLNFFITGMEAANCDECGRKGTLKKFDEHFKEWEEEIKEFKRV